MAATHDRLLGSPLDAFLEEEREDGREVRPELVERLVGITSPDLDVYTLRTLHDALVLGEGYAPERAAQLAALLLEHDVDTARAGWLRHYFTIRMRRGALPELTRAAFVARLEELRAVSGEEAFASCVWR